MNARSLQLAALVVALGGMVTVSEARAYTWPAPASRGGGPKRVVVDKSRQELRAYEGNQLVMQTRISTGRRGRETPSGVFRTRSKSLMHYSSRYHNAPMPYSVQFSGNYFIHGFSSVPRYPASHGCIRVPIGAARDFYNWVGYGTPVHVVGG